MLWSQLSETCHKVTSYMMLSQSHDHRITIEENRRFWKEYHHTTYIIHVNLKEDIWLFRVG